MKTSDQGKAIEIFMDHRVIGLELKTWDERESQILKDLEFEQDAIDVVAKAIGTQYPQIANILYGQTRVARQHIARWRQGDGRENNGHDLVFDSSKTGAQLVEGLKPCD